jgi:hypothetical protein
MYIELRLTGAALALTVVLSQARSAQAQGIAIDSISGPVTAHEIDSFKEFMRTRSPGTTSWGGSGAHNALADGVPGRDVEALGLMFEATGDREILDRMVFFVDAFITMRNDPVTGRIMWTGRREPIWVPTAPDSLHPGYAASEAADTVAHIAYAAKLIAQNRRLWDLTVPGGDPHGLGATYLQRARTYLQRCDQSMDEYFAKWFVEAGTNLIREPKDNPMWNLVEVPVRTPRGLRAHGQADPIRSDFLRPPPALARARGSRSPGRSHRRCSTTTWWCTPRKSCSSTSRTAIRSARSCRPAQPDAPRSACRSPASMRSWPPNSAPISSAVRPRSECSRPERNRAT